MIYLLPMLLADGATNEVLTPYAIEKIGEIKTLFVENVKTTRRFLSSLKIGIVIDEIKFIEINELKDYFEIYNILKSISGDCGIISEAGCAGVADPGATIIEVAQDLNLEIKPLVGPNSIILALMASGLNGQSFVFHGYLPIQEIDREKKLKAIEKEAALKKQTQIFIETPYRNNQILASMLKILNPNTKLCIAANITSAEEYIKTKR